MTVEQIISEIERLVRENNCSCIASVQSEAEGQGTYLVHGDMSEIAYCLFSMIDGIELTEEKLATLGAYCIAKAKGYSGFKDAQKFTDYLMGCADVFQEHSGLIRGSKEGLS